MSLGIPMPEIGDLLRQNKLLKHSLKETKKANKNYKHFMNNGKNNVAALQILKKAFFHSYILVFF